MTGETLNAHERMNGTKWECPTAAHGELCWSAWSLHYFTWIMGEPKAGQEPTTLTCTQCAPVHPANREGAAIEQESCVVLMSFPLTKSKKKKTLIKGSI